MLAWEDIRTHVQERLKLHRDTPGELELLWRFPGDFGHVSVVERLRCVEALGRQWLLVTAVIGSERSWPARVALKHNADLAIGAVAVDGDDYVVRHVVPLGCLTIAELDESLEVVAHEAAWVRVRFPADAYLDTTLFAHFVD